MKSPSTREWVMGCRTVRESEKFVWFEELSAKDCYWAVGEQHREWPANLLGYWFWGMRPGVVDS